MKTPESISSKRDIISVINKYCTFSDNTAYILMILARPKENKELSHQSNPSFKEILTERSMISSKYERLRAIADEFKLQETDETATFRMYLTVNSRDVSKASFQFQKHITNLQQKLQNGHTNTWGKMRRLDKEWISILQRESSKYDTRFLVDIDSTSDSVYDTVYDALDSKTTIVTTNKTPNGYHIVTEPFDYTSIQFDIEPDAEIEIKTDALLFLTMM